jgi:ribosome-binding ATPase YchF (GTP1/OBG family)
MFYVVLMIDNIVHVDGNVNPIRDKETIDIELQLKDLETVEKRLKKPIVQQKQETKKHKLKKHMLDRITRNFISWKISSYCCSSKSR